MANDLLKFERKNQPLLPEARYRSRVYRNLSAGVGLLVVFLLIGVVGYRYTCEFSWLDSLLNASMILSGMGPTNTITTSSGKVFASVYALASGVVFITTIGIIMAPVAHRFFHRFHLMDG